MSIKDKNILILTHYFAYGPAEDLIWYFTEVEPVKNVVIIKIPLHLDSAGTIHYIAYEQGRLVYKLSWKMNMLVTNTEYDVLNRFLEILQRLPMYISLMLKAKFVWNEKIDIAIAEDPLMAFIAIQLKYGGYVDNVVFHSHSYSIVKSQYLDPIFKRLYSFIDYYATRFSDVVWVLSNKLAYIRRTLGAKNVVQVPICIRDDVIDSYLKLTKKKENSAVFVGTLNTAKGADILIRIAPYITNVFDKVYIIGKGSLAPLFRKLSVRYCGRIIFYGPKPLKESAKIVAKSLLGFTLSRLNAEIITTDPMKPKLYLAFETPIIVPRYFEISKVVDEYHGGIVINYPNLNSIINAIKLFKSNQDLYVKGAKRIAEAFNRWRCSDIIPSVMETTMRLLMD